MAHIIDYNQFTTRSAPFYIKMKTNLYDILKISPFASDEEIEHALLMAKTMGTMSPTFLVKAEKVLLNKEKRKIYDTQFAKVIPPEPQKKSQPINTETQKSHKSPIKSAFCQCLEPIKNTQTGYCIQCGKNLRPPIQPTIYRYIH